ncbi:MAG: hypothetical protein NWR72_05305 [Bacteroidia bacterium]|nr:hypothetical protein [Bacteroidia bacterium]
MASSNGITLRDHDDVNGKVRVATLSPAAATRSVRGISPLLDLQSAGISLQTLGAGTRAVEGPNMLEINDLKVKNPEGLKTNPLQFELDATLGDDEVMFPVMWDGEHFRVIGESVVEASGQTVVNVREIPKEKGSDQQDPFETNEDLTEKQEGTRSLTRALKMAFFKIALKQNDLNKLRWVQILEGDEVAHHEEGLAQKIAESDNILLLIHGIIGNTADIATGLAKAKTPAGGELTEAYDLILSYDYENLNTSIEDTARLLKKQLKEAGFGEDDGKKLTILAHSMGGLVSRWMIEQEDGNRFVDSLILAGTPNNGSNFGKIEGFRSFSVIVLDTALNFLPNLIPFAATALKALKAPTKLLITLGQMEPGSDFIKKLNASKDPNVPYFIVGGDATLYEAGGEGFGRLMEKLELAVGDLVNKGEKHDIAVEINSIFNVGKWGSRTPLPKILTPVCHHLNYFHSETGMAALIEVGLGTREQGGIAVTLFEGTLPPEALEEEEPGIKEEVMSWWDRFVAKLREWMGV